MDSTRRLPRGARRTARRDRLESPAAPSRRGLDQRALVEHEAPAAVLQREGQREPAHDILHSTRWSRRAVTKLDERVAQAWRFNEVHDLGVEAAVVVARKPLPMEVD